MPANNEYLDRNFNGNAIRDVKIDPVSSDPSGGDLREGKAWFNTASGVLKYYDGTAVKTLATTNGTAREFVGELNASGGAAWPTSGSGSGGAIQAGDEWAVTTAGTIGSKTLKVGDSVVALVNNADSDGEFFVNAGNRVDLSKYAAKETQTVNVSANTETAVTATDLSVVDDVKVWAPAVSGKLEDITESVLVTKDASVDNKIYITSGTAFTGLRVYLQGAI